MMCTLTLKCRTLTWSFNGRQLKKGVYPSRKMALDAYFYEAKKLGIALANDSGILN